MSGFLCVATSVSLLVPLPALGQSSRVDVELGQGFAVGSGAENPAPSVPTLSFGAGLWFSERWGIAVTRVLSYGEDRLTPPVDSADRVFAGKEDLRYTRVVARYRRGAGLIGDLVLGFGLVHSASFVYIDYLKTPDGLERLRAKATWNGAGLEAYFQRRLFDHLTVRAGVTLDTGTETTVLQPVVLGVITF